MIDVEVLGASLAPHAPPPEEVRRLCVSAAASRAVEDGHVAVEFVDAARIAELNASHRGRSEPTDVLSFPIDGVEAQLGAASLAGGEAGTRQPAGSGAGGVGGLASWPVRT